MVERPRAALERLLQEIPYTNLIDLEDERIGARFQYGTSNFSSKVGGVIFCEFDARKV